MITIPTPRIIRASAQTGARVRLERPARGLHAVDNRPRRAEIESSRQGEHGIMGNSGRLAIAALGIALIGYFVLTSVEFDRPDAAQDMRPSGTVADIRALAERDDLNVLFILIDTLRSHRMSLYGYERDTTPFLRQLAETGVRFDRHIAQSSWTKSSMASLWAALNPLRVGITKFDHTVSHEFDMPAEILKEAGFMNVALYRNGWVHGYFGFDQGFDKYYRPMGKKRMKGSRKTDPNVLFTGTDEVMALEAEEFMRVHGQTERWFLYLHMMDLHEYIYDAESALFGTSTPDLYDNSVRRTDWILSLLFGSLAKLDLLDETIVVILSDHGEAFGERGFDGHAREVLPETTETPLIISLPFALQAPAVVTTPTSNTDVWPTILDLLGLRQPEHDIDGRSRVPEIIRAASLKGLDAPEESDAIISYLDQNWGQNTTVVEPTVSVVHGDFRYVKGRQTTGMPFDALFTTEDGSQANRIDDYPEVAERLKALADAHVETTADFGVEAVKMDEMQLDQLRALGYELR